MKSLLRVTLLVSLLSLVSGHIWAHPGHVSLAEVEVTDGRLEVALQLKSEDADRLTKKDKRPLADALKDLIRSHFVVSAPDGAILAHRWLGIEDKRSHIWMYFEVKLDGPLKGHHLTFDVLLAHHRRQINTVIVRQGGARKTMTFTSRTPRLPL